MNRGNVAERRAGPPDVGVCVVMLSLGPHAQTSIGFPDHTGRETSDDLGSGDHDLERAEFWVPLVQRVRQPHLGKWALPGGDLKAYQSLEQSAYRAVASTTDLNPRYLEQLYAFGDPDRSRGGLPMVSIVYWALVGSVDANSLRDDEHVAWFPEHRLPDLAFDHRTIIDYTLQRLRTAVEYPYVATALVGSIFTLSQLRGVYEAVLKTSIDPANFRRRMLASRQLEDTGQVQRSGRQRPAALYRYADAAFDTCRSQPDGALLPMAMREALRQRVAQAAVRDDGEDAPCEQDCEEYDVAAALSPLMPQSRVARHVGNTRDNRIKGVNDARFHR